MIVSLGMYDLPATMAANDRLWQAIRDHLRQRGIAAPASLTRGEQAYWPAWQAADLLLSQTCGYPYRARLHDRVAYVGTPDYGIEGCPPGHYRSLFVCRADDPRHSLAEFDGARFAFNEDLSQSGWAAPQIHAARLGISLPPAIRTGGHRLSALSVVEGRADIAALDAVTHALLAASDPVATGLRVIAATDQTPGLPLITAQHGQAEVLFDAVSQAIADLRPADRETLRLRALIRIPKAAYLAVPTPPAPAAFAGTD